MDRFSGPPGGFQRGRVAFVAAVCLISLHCGESGSAQDPLRAPELAGHRISGPGGMPICCGTGTPAGAGMKAIAVWVLSGKDCNWCNATEVGYWRSLLVACPSLGIQVIAVGPDSQRIRQFVARYRFPGALSSSRSMGELGLSGWSTPMWFLVDSTSTVILASAIRTVADPYPLRVLRLGRALGGCTANVRPSSD
jgi:hypothetical protein